MTNEIRARIDQIRQGKVPEGYVRTRAGIMPSDWPTTIKARDVFYSYSVKSSGCGLTVLSATQDRGIVPRSEVDIDIKYDTNNLDSYKKVDVGDFVISLRSFQGGIECSAYEGIVSPAYTVLKNRIAICNGYYREYFKTDDFIARLNGAVYGIRDGKQIGFDDFGDMLIHCPSLQEQERIAKILSTCDRIIDKYEEKTDQYRKLKQYLLDKMFPKEGAAVPEIRFPNFTDAWEQRKFGDENDLITGYPFESEKYVEEGISLIRGMNVKRGYLDLSDEICMKWDSSEGLENYLLEDGDILIQMDGALIGKSYARISPNQLPALLVQRVTRARTKRGIANSDFMYQTIQRDFLTYIKMNKTETAVPHLSLNDIRDFMIMVPSLDEQKKIGEFFTNLDNLITLHLREAEAWKTKKKALAQLLLTGIVRV